jgi:AMP-polyphosphate phosphotransferase
MFRSIATGPAVSRQDFKSREPGLWSALLERQRALREPGVSTLIILAGPEGGGKGEVVDQFHRWFDTRGVESHAFWTDSDEERERPRMWRYWRRLAPRGTIAIMFGAWYWMPLYQRVRHEITAGGLDREARRIAALEHMLSQDGMLIVKLWLHLDRDTHERRMRKRREIHRHVRGQAAEGQNGRQFEAFLQAAERLIRITGDGPCPWHLVDAGDRWSRDLQAAGIVLDAMARRLNAQRAARAGDESARPPVSAARSGTALERLDLTATLGKQAYRRELRHWQARLSGLAWRAWDARIPAVAVFEGWDAAGKGGIIRRMVTAMDARLYQVVPVGAPNDVERARHYLWRFWRRLPRAGLLTVYDRSWYGRVLVERVEGFASEEEWRRAYDEINDFEHQLVDHGIVLAKYWLHISADEQLRRFRERENAPWKRHKITAEDWRNRERRPDYLEAVEAMIARTGTGKAPWTLIAAEDKRHARIAVLRSYCEKLETALDH